MVEKQHKQDDAALCSIVCPVIWSFLWIVSAKGDTEVSCVFMESCILPWSFQSGADPVIHWFLETARDLHVHSFYSNQDQLGLQDQRFRNRTSLFKDQISRGNASLQLTGVEVQDQGRPPSNLNLQKQTSIQQTEQQLYNISSSLILSDSETDLIYICTISTHSNSRNTHFV
ncbi:CD276 antigen-like isoform X1 [Lates japonicus]|uniref:CD276 antigen-like isoform X1 n=1 Tax=Lates japonicus TaxID=270547 RepID=A0AAD3R460_LATJO|nr:CD276 antigen-like isoform X1 [Lates japonicus]